MEKLVNWLVEIENAAAEAYLAAAGLFRGDADFSEFLARLGADERGHSEAMRLASAHIKEMEHYPAIVALDEETKWEIEAPFVELRTAIEDGKAGKEELMNSILVIEYSELNQLFLYVLNAAKECSGAFSGLSVDIESHKGRIEKYIETHSEFDGYLDRVRGLPGASSTGKILIVDDTESNLAMLKAIFANRYAVDTAGNGADAFRKLRAENYSAVISDVEMPVMDGIEFYRKAREIFPGINSRFIFYTSSLDRERISFFNENRLKYLVKPTPISKIRAAVTSVAS